MSGKEPSIHWPTFFALLLMNIMVAYWFGYAAMETTYHLQHNTAFYSHITTHISHLDSAHMLGNLSAWLILWMLFPVRTVVFWLATIWSIMACGLYVQWAQIETYLGFSAILYCLPGAYLWHALRTRQLLIVGFILLILYIYLFMITPYKVTNDGSWQSMTVAHLMGFMAGCCSAALVDVMNYFGLMNSQQGQQTENDDPFSQTSDNFLPGHDSQHIPRSTVEMWQQPISRSAGQTDHRSPRTTKKKPEMQ